jgi:citrate lyase subunit alpha/citrate CoA-transferase
MTGPGSLIDVVVTERGLCINPLRGDLIDSVKGSDLPVVDINQLHKEAIRICGGVPEPPHVTDHIVAVVKWVDGTLLDSIRQLAPM